MWSSKETRQKEVCKNRNHWRSSLPTYTGVRLCMYVVFHSNIRPFRKGLRQVLSSKDRTTRCVKLGQINYRSYTYASRTKRQSKITKYQVRYGAANSCNSLHNLCSEGRLTSFGLARSLDSNWLDNFYLQKVDSCYRLLDTFS